MPVLPDVGSRIVCPGGDRALLLGVLDQRARHAVLDRAGRVARLELGPDAHARLGRQASAARPAACCRSTARCRRTGPRRPVLPLHRRSGQPPWLKREVIAATSALARHRFVATDRWPDNDACVRLRLRLAGHRLRLRRQRLGAAPGREGLLGGRARVRPALRRRRVAELDRGPEALLLEPAAGHEGHLPADHLQGRLGRLRLRRRRRQPRATRTRSTCRRRRSSRTASGRSMEDWESALAPHYAEAQRMLGVVQNPHEDPADQLLRELGEELGVGDTYKKTPVGVFFGEPGKTVPDPYFGGEGPDRTGCRLCGRCMVGCPHGVEEHARQELPVPRRAPRRAGDARTHGHRHPPDRRGRRQRRATRSKASARARGCARTAACSARAAWSSPPAPLGTNKLLQRCRRERARCRASPHRLGRARAHQLRVDPRGDGARGLPRRPRSSASRSPPRIYPDPNTHIETVTYGDDGDSMHRLNTLLVGDGTRVTRPLKLLAADPAAPEAPRCRCCSPSTGRGARSSSS